MVTGAQPRRDNWGRNLTENYEDSAVGDGLRLITKLHPLSDTYLSVAREEQRVG